MKTESNKNSISHRVWFAHEEADIDNNKICLPIDFILLKLFLAGLKYQKISSLKIIPQFPSLKFYNLLRYLQISTIKGVDCGHAFSMCTVQILKTSRMIGGGLEQILWLQATNWKGNFWLIYIQIYKLFHQEIRNIFDTFSIFMQR